MTVRISVNLSREPLEHLDFCCRTLRQNRSAFIEAILREKLRRIKRDELGARDIEIIDRNADELNAEAEDVFSYQKPL